MGEPGGYTPRGLQFDSVVKYLTGGDLAFREQGLASRYTQNLSPLGDPATAPPTAPARRALSTRNATLEIDPGLGVSTAELNAGLRRYDPAPGARSLDQDPVFADFTGRISVPVLTIHDTGDAFVPFKFEQNYRLKTVDA